MFGRGTYSAETTKYSHDGYRFRMADGMAQIIVARVAAGKVKHLPYSTETQSLVRPPDGYDSVRGNVGGTEAVIVYETAQAYPAYLVTYKE
jgi:hypothetical protein